MVSFNTNSTTVFNNHISVKAAAKISGYSLQYIRRLLRKGNLGGEKIGQVWLVDLKSLNEYFELAANHSDCRFGPRIS